MKNEKVTDLTPEQMLAIVTDPIKLASILYSLSQLDDLEQLIEEHGEEKLFELACDVANEVIGGGQNG